MENNNTINVLRQNKKQILDQWMSDQLASHALREDLMSSAELRKQSEDIVNALLNSLTEQNLATARTEDFSQMMEIMAAISFSRARQGFSPREVAAYVFSLKYAILSILQAELSDPGQLHAESMKVSTLIDSFGINTFEVFIKGREEVILRQVDEISEISNPVIQLWKGVVAIPLIGTLDSARTQVVMESLLQQIVETESSIAILDISGVPAVDSLVAQHLIKTVSATRLMGAECIISGIRPEIAQTIVHLGIDLSQIVTKSSLAHALQLAFDMMQVEVVRKQKKTF